jgi:hypothetical protein
MLNLYKLKISMKKPWLTKTQLMSTLSFWCAFEDLKQQTKIVDSETDAEDILDVKQFGKESIEADFKGSIDPDLRLFWTVCSVW